MWRIILQGPQPCAGAQCGPNGRLFPLFEEMKAKAIEATPVIEGEKVDARLPPRLPDRRYRRI